MRRLLFCLVMLQGLVLPSSLPAKTTHPHAPAHPAKRRQSAPSKSSREARKHASHAEALRSAQRHPTNLHPARVDTAALIDPVPLGRFPILAPLKGSHESLLRQNARSQADGLSRVQDDADLLALRRSGQLVALPTTPALAVDERLPANRRYCRAWTAEFLTDLSRVHYRRFHRALQVNSAVRTVEYQRHLELINGNAAPAEGDDASPHLTGSTIDIAKKGLSMDEIGWLRAYLAPLQAAGKLDVEEEFYQSCFHITVYRSYKPVSKPGSSMEEAKASSNAHRAGNAALLADQVH